MDRPSVSRLHVFKNLKQHRPLAYDSRTALRHREVQFSTSMINATQLIACFAILSLKIKLLSTTVRAQRTVHNLNTSLLTFNSLANFAIPIEHTMSVVLATENAWQIDVMVS